MGKVPLTILTTVALMSASCGRGGSSGPVTAPTPVGQAQAPTVDVQGAGSSPADAPPTLVRWDGNVSFDAQTGSNTMALELRQSAAQVNGQFLIYGPDGGAGPVAGTVSGNVFSFNFSIGNQRHSNCGHQHDDRHIQRNALQRPVLRQREVHRESSVSLSIILLSDRRQLDDEDSGVCRWWTMGLHNLGNNSRRDQWKRQRVRRRGVELAEPWCR